MSRVAAVYPFDGPHTPATVIAAAADLAGLVRYLANATRRGDSLPQPADLAKVVGSLQQAVADLPQVLHQLARHADRYGTWSDLYDAHGDDPVMVAGLVALNLTDAAQHLPIAATDLAAAHEAASRLGINEGNTR